MESVVENSMVVAGVTTQIDDLSQSNKSLADLWHRFWKENLPAKITNRSNNTIYVIYHDYQDGINKGYAATIGYRVNHIDESPSELTIIVIPQQRYHVFTAHGNLPESVTKTWKKIMQANLQRTFSYDFEIYDERAQNPQDAIVDIYVSILK